MFYMVLLGGSHPATKIEVHDVVFVLADSLVDAYPLLKSRWFGDKGKVHIDCWMLIHGVDGYRIEFRDTPSDSELHLYFVNLGGYIQGQFGEEHKYMIVSAENDIIAKSKAKTAVIELWDKPHKDHLTEIDDCIRLDGIDGRFIHLVTGDYPKSELKQEHIVL